MTPRYFWRGGKLEPLDAEIHPAAARVIDGPTVYESHVFVFRGRPVAIFATEEEASKDGVGRRVVEALRALDKTTTLS